MVDLGPFIDPNASLGPEWGNPLFYFNAGALVVGVLLLLKLRDRRGESSLADGMWWGGLVLTVGSGLHFIGDLTAVAEAWDHQFIHFVVLVAMLVFFVFARRGD